MNLPTPRRLSALLLTATAGLTAQTVWYPVAVAVPPQARRDALLVQDSVRDRIVLFGGIDVFGVLHDTWEFDGAQWIDRHPAHVPTGTGSAMAYDRGRARTVLLTATNHGAETWEYDGVDWAPVNTAHAPAASDRDAMVYDAGRGVMVAWLQGHSSAPGQTWEYDGIDWTRRTPAASPPIVHDAGMVFDVMRNRAILHGGWLSNGNLSAATWEYDGATWTLATNQAGSPSRADFGFAYDAARRRAVLFGGQGSYGAGTFEYYGPWLQRTSAGPQDRVGAAMVYDVLRQDCVLFGGADPLLGTYYQDTFRYRALSQGAATTFGQGCSGTSVAPGLLPAAYQVPYVGMSFGVQFYSLPGAQPAFLALGLSRTLSGSTPLPASLQPQGMPGCSLFVSLDTVVPANVSGHSATLTIQVPNRIALRGLGFYLQGFAIDVGGNPANCVVTRAIDCRVGAL